MSRQYAPVHLQAVERGAVALQFGEDVFSEVEEFARRHAFEDRRFENVQSRINELGALRSLRRLFLEIDDAAGRIQDDDAVLRNVLFFNERDRGDRFGFLMKSE